MHLSQIEFIAPKNCDLCPRLANFIDQQRHKFPHWYNGAVPSFGPVSAPVLILGLAPGLRGANATGRPFTGDFAGQVLYETLIKLELADGTFQPDGQDDLHLRDIRITNAVKCVPPQNKPTAVEIATCRPFLSAELEKMHHLRAIFVLGRIAHETVLRHFNLRPADYPFKHDIEHKLPNGLVLISSYHCSRYNVQTRRLSPAMFEQACKRILGFT